MMLNILTIVLCVFNDYLWIFAPYCTKLSPSGPRKYILNTDDGSLLKIRSYYRVYDIFVNVS